MSYYDTILRYDWETTRRAIYAKNDADVERALAAERPTMDDFAALVSPPPTNTSAKWPRKATPPRAAASAT